MHCYSDQESLREQRLLLRQQQLAQLRLLSLRSGGQSPPPGPQKDKLRLKETPSGKNLGGEAVDDAWAHG